MASTSSSRTLWPSIEIFFLVMTVLLSKFKGVIDADHGGLTTILGKNLLDRATTAGFTNSGAAGQGVVALTDSDIVVAGIGLCAHRFSDVLNHALAGDEALGVRTALQATGVDGCVGVADLVAAQVVIWIADLVFDITHETHAAVVLDPIFTVDARTGLDAAIGCVTALRAARQL